MEQTTERDEENYNEISQEYHDAETEVSPNTPKKHRRHKPKKTQKTHKIPHCKKNPQIPVVKNTTYVRIPTQTTLTLTDTRYQNAEKSFYHRSSF